MNHIQTEISRISARLAAYPDPFEHAGLYAAQQALSWALQPDAFASPLAIITRSEANSADCSEQARLRRLPDIDGAKQDEPER